LSAATTLGGENAAHQQEAHQQEIARMRTEAGDATFMLLEFNAAPSSGDELGKWTERVQEAI
jgi:hypothetical protein